MNEIVISVPDFADPTTFLMSLSNFWETTISPFITFCGGISVILTLFLMCISIYLSNCIRKIHKLNILNSKKVFWGNLLTANINNHIACNKEFITHPELFNIYGIASDACEKYMDMTRATFVQITNRFFGSLIYYMPSPVRDRNTNGFERNSILRIFCARARVRRAWPFVRKFLGPQLFEHHYSSNYFPVRRVPPLREETAFATFVSKVDYEIYTRSLINLKGAVYNERKRSIVLDFQRINKEEHLGNRYLRTNLSQINSIKTDDGIVPSELEEITLAPVTFTEISDFNDWEEFCNKEGGFYSQLSNECKDIVFHYKYRGTSRETVTKMKEMGLLISLEEYVERGRKKAEREYNTLGNSWKKIWKAYRESLQIPNDPLALMPPVLAHRLFLVSENDNKNDENEHKNEDSKNLDVIAIVLFTDFHSNSHYEPVINIIANNRDKVKELIFPNIEYLCFDLYQLPWTYVYQSIGSEEPSFTWIQNNRAFRDAEIWSNMWDPKKEDNINDTTMVWGLPSKIMFYLDGRDKKPNKEEQEGSDNGSHAENMRLMKKFNVNREYREKLVSHILDILIIIVPVFLCLLAYLALIDLHWLPILFTVLLGLFIIIFNHLSTYPDVKVDSLHFLGTFLLSAGGYFMVVSHLYRSIWLGLLVALILFSVLITIGILFVNGKIPLLTIVKRLISGTTK